MASVLQQYRQLADHMATQITGSYQSWTDFLTTAARLYKYPYHEQLMIYAQRPDATACADYELWNKRMGRYVRRGAKGIALIDHSGDAPKLKYVFDAADTRSTERSRSPYLWEYRPEHAQAVSAALEEQFAVPNDGSITEQLEQISSVKVTEYFLAHQQDILGIVDGSYLEGYHDYDKGVAFLNAATVSTTYALLSRCGLAADAHFDPEEFMPVFDFNTPQTVFALGSAVSEISEEVLRSIEVTIKKYEREKLSERSQENERTDLHPQRGLLDSQSDPAPAGDAASGQVRTDAEEISSGASPGAVEQPDPDGEAVSPSEGDRRDSEPAVGADDAGAHAVGGGDGSSESQQSNEMGGADEQPESPGGGSDSDGADLRLTDEPPIRGEQFSFFPTEAQQIAYIAEAESADIAPSAFSMPQEYIDQFLRYGSNTENHRTRIAIEYAKQKPMDDLVGFLEKTYHGGYGLQFGTAKVCAWCSEDGMHLAYGSTARFAKNAQILSWEDVAVRVGELLEQGQFATNVELAECGTFEKRQLAEQLWYMSHDMSEKAVEAGHMSIVRSLRGGFPEETEKLIVFLSEPESYQAIMRQVYAFRDACNTDKGMLRFQMYHPNKLIRPLEEYTLPRREYVSEMAELPEAKGFITEDEINEHLTGGSNFSGSKGRIYAYYQSPHTAKEKLDFLKNEYGIGGGNNALSRNFMSHVWTDGKGIRYDKPNCTRIEVPWTKVVKYYDALMESGRFAPPEELEQRYGSEEAIDSEIVEEVPEIPTSEPTPVSEEKEPAVWEYNEIKSAHPEDIVLYQVGDFFEIYGEDAKQATPVLDLHLGTRPIPTGGRVDMCGIPAHLLEEATQKLRDRFHVTIAAVGEDGQRNSYSMGKLNPEPPRREITQSDIDEALQKWNGSIDSKHAVVRYMEAHSRERDTAAWLAEEYGADLSQPLRITVTGVDTETVLPWGKVQRRIAQLIKADKFYTEEEYDRLDDIDPAAIREQLAEHGIVNGEVVDGDKLDAAPIVRQAEADAQRISDEEFARDHLIPGESTFEIDGRTFLVDRVNLDSRSVNFQDITFANSTGFPIFRTEPISFVRRYIEEQENQPVQPEMSTETVAVYPGEKNNLPYDIVVQTLRTEQPEPPRDAPIPSAENFRITDEDLGMGGAKVKFRRNMDAITTLKTIESEGRQATREEQEILSRYVGWGGLPDAFDDRKSGWTSEYQELKNTLTPAEYEAARASTLNAHYTSPTVIRAIYEAVGNMGFQTGNILEPSMGVGNFFGMLPEEMRNSRLYGVELDSITGRIAKQLYPKANITVAGFETTDRQDFFDLAVGNVPFGQYKVNDPAYNKLGFNIHNYFFAKALDQVRPGGVVAFVTSRYTLDAKDSTVRRYLAQRADLLGAIRLPNTAFKANAGTEVVSDIIFLQKRDRPIEIEPDWVHLGQTEDGYAINSYFLDHPEMVMGRNSSESTAHGMDYTVEPLGDISLADQLHEAVQHIQGTYQEAELPDLGEGEAIQNTLPADPDVKDFSYTLVDGEVYFRENSIMVRPDLNATAKERIKGMLALSTCVHELIDLQMQESTPDSAIQEKQGELNRLYDSFTEKYGLINSRGNKLAFSDDSSYFLLCALEVMDDDGNFQRKADMFTKRTIQPHRVVTSVDTASEALTISIAERACVDLGFMSSLSGKPIEELTADLRGVIFHDPTLGPLEDHAGWVTADEYLSGNVRQKLRQAEAAAAENPAYQVNVEALRAAQPKDLDASEIEVRLGATWIDRSYILQVWKDGKADKLTQLVFCDISTPQAAPKAKQAVIAGNPLEAAALPAEENAPFTVYNDIRSKLIDGGVPAEQIAFIHDANTEVKKKELFGKVRSGQVRVLLGSTSKMGAGTNVQDRLVAIHDLDCPWRPGDLQQRKGRIERQGNQNEKVHVFRYVTEGTFDAFLWQTVENKQKFISQIMTSKSPVRSCNDVDEVALSFAEIKALCAGDPRIKERMDLDVEVSRLKIMKADHKSKQYRLEDSLLRHFPEQIEKLKGCIQAIQEDMKTLEAHPHPKDGFAGMTVLADELTDKDNAGAALIEAAKKATGLDPVEVGTYRGFTMSVTLEDFGKKYVLTMQGRLKHQAILGSDPRGNLIRLDNALAQMPQRLKAFQTQLDETCHQQEAAKAELGKPFPFEEELRDKTARLIFLDAELNLDANKGSQTEQVIAKSARPSVLDKLRSQPVPIRNNQKQKHHEEVR